MLPYLVCKNFVVWIIAPNIIQGLNNRVEAASHFFREVQSILLLFK